MTRKAHLRSLTVFPDPMPPFDAEKAAETPAEQFETWLDEALEAHVFAPHVTTLSTLGPDGHPTARTLILKDFSDQGWKFAGQKGTLDHAALTFYWAAQGRQIRLRGPVVAATPEESAADFLARPPAARAEAFAGRQSEPLAGPDELEAAVLAARARIDAEPDLVSPAWTLYTVVADEVEFFQASPDRMHVRLRYRQDGAGWRRERLWP